MAEVAHDKFGSILEGGDVVEYHGTRYEVLEVLAERNVVRLSVGNVSAVECELVD
jgi:hypothetical protein